MYREKLIFVWIISTLFVSLLTPVSIAQAESVYRNEEGSFSLTLPNGWGAMPQSEVDKLGNQAGVTGKNAKHIALFQKTINGVPYARIDVQIRNMGRMPEKDLQQFLSDKNQQAIIQREADKNNKERTPEHIRKKWSPMEYGKMTYDEKSHILFMKTRVTKDSQVWLALLAEALSSYGYIGFNLYCSEDVAEYIVDDYTQIIYSLKFDDGYGY